MDHEKVGMTFNKKSLSIAENPQLFSDYLYAFENLSSFFRWHPEKDLKICLEKRQQNYQLRKKIPEILVRQNRHFKNSAQLVQTLEKLKADNTMAIVTGQQVGLYGGPLYTIYKIITVLKLADHLAERYPEWQFVPLFWMEVGDSDYQEINHFYLINQLNELVRLGLPETPDNHQSIYHRKIPAEITQLREQLKKLFPDNDFRDAILDNVQESYAPGRSFHTAFAEWIQYLLADSGIPMIFPADQSLAELAQPIYQKTLQDWQIIQQHFSNTNRQLQQQKYHVQIQLDPGQTLLFYEADDGSRSRIDGENGNFLIRSPQVRQKISEEELFKKLSQQPERFTPNVALRPVIQDWLFPTVIYVAGPGEISYAAQLKPVYENLQIIPPVFYPRLRISLIESKIEKVVSKFKVDITEIFELREEWLEQKIQRQADTQFNKLFQDSGSIIKNEMIKLQESLSRLDPALDWSTQKTATNMLELLDKLRQKTDEAYWRKMNSDLSQLNKVLTNLFPGGNFQERTVNILQYIIKYGPEFIKKLYDSVDIHDRHHQLIFL